MSQEDKIDIDVSKLKVIINGHKHKVTGVRIVRHKKSDDDGWLQFGMEDEATGHHQCVEIEVSGLLGLWESVSDFPDQIRQFIDDMAGVGRVFADRVMRAVDVFRNDTSTKE